VPGEVRVCHAASLRAKENAICQRCATIVVDVANVMGSRPDGWWRDRAGAAVRLYAELADLAASGRVALPPEAVPPAAAGPPPAAQPGAAQPGAAQPGAAGPPGFVMVLEGAAKAAAARISSAAPPAVVDDSGAPIQVRPGEVTVVDDSGAPIQVRPGEVTVVLALGSGDDAIVAVARALPGHRVVVTADRELRQRCVAAGATVLGPAWLLGLLRP
jgi:8-oxo-dGTP diphosphatase